MRKIIVSVHSRTRGARNGAERVLVGFYGGIQQLAGEDTAVILPALFGSICAVGIVGNVLVLVVLISNIMVSKRASGITVMLANLSGADWCCSVWVLGLVLPVFQIGFSKVQVKGNFSLCVTEVPSHSSDFMRVYSKIYAVVVYAFPLIFSVVCHVHPIFRITGGSRAQAACRTQSRLALLSVTAANAFLLLPEWIVWQWMRHRSYETWQCPGALLVLAQVCTYLTIASSPAILLTMCVPLREDLAWLMCQGASREEEEERSGMADSVLDDSMMIHTDALGRPLPDVKHFWTSRRNTALPDNSHPFPWEELEHCHADF